MAIRNENYEKMPRDELEQLQLERLQVTVNRAYRNVSFYRKFLDDAQISPEDITSLSDLSKIPFTTKEMLRENQPYGMFALPLREVIRLQTTSGTTGEPIVVGYTQRDIEHWTELIARVLTMSGVTKDDVVQISFDYGLFTGALGFHYGAEKIGATVIPCSRVSLEKQIAIMRNYRTTVLICTPTFAFQIAEKFMAQGINLAELSLRVGLFGAEPWPEEMRRKIEDILHITAIDNYGLSEIIGPGVSCECEQKNGLHIFEEHFIPEIINPKTGEVLSDGEKGELALTTITKEAFPMIRYRTGDISSLEQAPCACGRTLARMSRVMERTDDMIVIQGVNVFPSAIKKILAEIEGAEPHFRLIVDRNQIPEELEIWVEVSEDIFSDEIKGLVALKQRIQDSISEALRLPVRVKLVEPKSIREL
ncbi:phenylacetate--CoA ligase [Candidatus Poribacteria bacterium]|nr:phenylacetate--CoA ligase [Candidatus Poribacteria bacterium]